jgi:hypothetical protein
MAEWSKYPMERREYEIVTPQHQGTYQGESSVAPIPTGSIADSWVPFLTKSGLAGLAFFLVYILTGDMRVDVASIKAELALHAADAAKTEKTLESLVNVTVQQCVNAAPTTAKRDACFVAMTFAPVRDPR